MHLHAIALIFDGVNHFLDLLGKEVVRPRLIGNALVIALGVLGQLLMRHQGKDIVNRSKVRRGNSSPYFNPRVGLDAHGVAIGARDMDKGVLSRVDTIGDHDIGNRAGLEGHHRHGGVINLDVRVVDVAPLAIDLVDLA